MKQTEQTKKPPRGMTKDKDYTSQYKGVSRYTHPIYKFVWYCARYGKDYQSYHFIEIDAAKAVDKVRISKGLSPINVFKKNMKQLTQFLSNEILVQKLRKNTDKHYIQSIQKMLDKESMSKDDFINTGRLMPISIYLSEYGNPSSFHKDVKDVMRYAGGFYIQILPTSEWLFDSNDANESDEVSTTFRSMKISDVEDAMWEQYVQKKIQ
jgi:hypothetical protein